MEELYTWGGLVLNIITSLYSRLEAVQTMEELRDVYSHFMLYYGHEIPAMRLAKKKKSKDEGQEEGEETQDDEPEERLKMPKRRDLYTICREAGTYLALFSSLYSYLPF
jgi:transcription elongation factor SPT6